MELRFLTLALALGLDKVFGEPEFVWNRVPHPIIWFGKAIDWAEKRCNKPNDSSYVKRRNGFVVIAGLLVLSAALGALLHWLLQPLGLVGLIIEATVASILLAHKSLIDHVSAVGSALQTGGVSAGRESVARIVGRDTTSLDEAGICRAAIESLAENFADGVIAPAFWFLIAGLPGLFAYKMLNTADSMIGHMSERYLDFGRAAAKLDDAANFLPARLTGVIYAVACWIKLGVVAGQRAFATMMRDARLHRSPNSGWPEAALAGGLGIAVAGPRVYKGAVANEPMINGSGKRNLNGADIAHAIDLTNIGHFIFCVGVLIFIILS